MINKVIVNGITFSGDGSTPFWFKKITGLEAAQYRNTIIVYSDRSGATVPKQLKGQRIITLEGGLDERSCNDHLQARQDLLTALGFNEWKPVDVYLSDGRILRNYCKFDTPNLPIEGRRYTDFQLIMLCRYNDFDDVSGGAGTNTEEVRKAVSGGWREYENSGWREYTDKGFREYAGKGPINAVNTGTTNAYPVIYIRGSVQNPIIRNTTTGEQFKVNITTSDTDVIKIDTRLQATTLNGGSINALVDPSSKYFTLKPGDNMLEFFSDAGTGYAEVTWFGAYGGI